MEPVNRSSDDGLCPPEVSVVVPAKNEAAGLSGLLPDLLQLECVDEIIVVDDGSDDNTAAVCEEFGVRCVSHPYSKGNGAAIKTGARSAKGDIIVFMDGDGQHKAEDIPPLLQEYRKGYDLIIGARDSKGQASWLRGIANAAYNKFSSWMTGHRILDLTSGFRVVSAKKFREFLYMLPNGFSYPTTSTMAFLRTGYSVGFVPIDVRSRIGKSHINVLKDGVKFFLIIFKVATLYSPLKLFSLVSFFLFMSGLSYYLYTFIEYNRFTNMGLALVLSSILVFLIGLISEQVSTLFYKK